MERGKKSIGATDAGKPAERAAVYWAQRLQKERLARQRSQRQVAALARLSPTTVGNLEQGRGTMGSLLKAANAIGVDPYDLMWLPVA